MADLGREARFRGPVQHSINHGNGLPGTWTRSPFPPRSGASLVSRVASLSPGSPCLFPSRNARMDDKEACCPEQWQFVFQGSFEKEKKATAIRRHVPSVDGGGPHFGETKW